MDPQKDFLIALSQTAGERWRKQGTEVFANELHLETANTVYRFLDGICYTVTKKGQFDRARSRAEGLRLIGWLVLDETGELALSLHARNDAAAVLWRENADGEQAFMFTSRTIAVAKSHRDEVPEAKAALLAFKRSRPDPQSVARVFTAAPLAPLAKAG